MIRLDPGDTYGILTTKLALVAARLTIVLLKLISFEITVPSKEQDESKAVYYKRQTAKDISINWELMDAPTIIALINACNPWNKGATTKISNRIVRFLEAAHSTAATALQQCIPGTVVSIDADGVTVCTINNQLVVVRIIYMDEGFMSAARLIEIGIVAGAKFENI